MKAKLVLSVVGHHSEFTPTLQEYTLYHVRVLKEDDKSSQIIYRRYSHFEELNEELLEIGAKILRELPPKKWFGNTAPEFIEKRQLDLDSYLKNLIDNNNSDLLLSQPITDFLDEKKKDNERVKIHSIIDIREFSKKRKYDWQDLHDLLVGLQTQRPSGGLSRVDFIRLSVFNRYYPPTTKWARNANQIIIHDISTSESALRIHDPLFICRLFNSLERNNCGMVKNRDIVACLAILGSSPPNEKLEFCWNVYATNNDVMLIEDLESLLFTIISVLGHNLVSLDQLNSYVSIFKPVSEDHHRKAITNATFKSVINSEPFTALHDILAKPSSI